MHGTWGIRCYPAVPKEGNNQGVSGETDNGCESWWEWWHHTLYITIHLLIDCEEHFNFCSCK